MHASVRSFMETNFASLLHAGELDLEGHHQLCRDHDVENDPPEGDPFKVGSSSTALALCGPFKSGGCLTRQGFFW
ncbi:unnamed protein product [Lactuca virosa]|uniref:Uncharacterized protein n=1 Tax=Lactuca virosa TaxID=75947 RepID=A0AAU9NU34_9ASTR|nr:unnamed protein product [Lactuca virosa]